MSRKSKTPGVPRVALLVETSRGYGRDLLRGIMRYARLHGPWSFYLTPGDFAQMLPRMRDWGGTGIIARIQTPAVARAILESGLPTIALDLSERQLMPSHPLSRLSEVASDSTTAAQVAVDHLRERGFRHFAFVGEAGSVWSRRRQASFRAHLRSMKFVVHEFPTSPRSNPRDWESEQAVLAAWLSRLPRPLGLMACNDDRGRDVLEACRGAGLRVPEEIAVIGVDNDELLCELSDPPLSSVALNAEAGGYRAAQLLDAMMQGRITEPARLTVEPTGVVTRRSTDIRAWEDPLVADAQRYLEENLKEPISIDRLAALLEVSRRGLEKRFKQSVGRTIREQLEHNRLDRVRRLLAETRLPLAEIASQTGFQTPNYLHQVFRAAHGTTPAEFRRQLRGEVSGIDA